jgi:hypothetical protein
MITNILTDGVYDKANEEPLAQQHSDPDAINCDDTDDVSSFHCENSISQNFQSLANECLFLNVVMTESTEDISVRLMTNW